MYKFFFSLISVFSIVAHGAMAEAASRNMPDNLTDPENALIVDTSMGEVVIQMFPDVAPNHVERLKLLARDGFYDGIKFHRVIEGFMAQTGDPNSKADDRRFWGTGGSEYPDLDQEFSSVSFERGTLGMARSASPNSANSQFFICFRSTPHLDGQYTVFGQVISGMKFIDRLAVGEPPAYPDEIISMKVYADVN